MRKTTKKRERRQHERSITVVRRREVAGTTELTVCLKQDGESTFYRVLPVSSDFGEAFSVEKPEWERDSERYDVLLDENVGDSCSCKGFTYHGYCRHVDGLHALRTAGKLPLPVIHAEPVPEVAEDTAYKPGHSSSSMPF